VGEVRAGADGYLEELQYPVGNGEGYVEYWTRDEAAYALRVRGDSMHPRYRAGEFVVVTPSGEPRLGGDVVVACHDGRKMLKQLNWMRDGEIQLLSVNGDYTPLTLMLSDILAIHNVAGSVPRDAFINS
jgi:phage repressor protein C with HTH and peptisase S24 domain